MRTLWVAVFSICQLLPQNADSACTFPSYLTGIWHGSDLGQAVFTSSKFTLTNKLMKVDSNTFIMSQFNVLTFNCEEQLDNLIYIKSDEFNQYFANFRIAMCWQLTYVTSTKIVYNSAMSVLLNTTNARFLLKSSTATFSMATDCKLTGPYDPSTVRVLVRDGYISSAKIKCPDSLLGSFSYEFDSGTGNKCYSNSYMASCADQTLLEYNYTLCTTKQAYSAEGQLHCVYYITSGESTYVTLYNKDSSTPNELSTFRFSCYAIYNVTATQYPQACMPNQNHSVYVSPGALVTFNRLSSCPPVEDILSAATLVSVIVVLLLVICGITIGFYCWKKMKTTKKVGPDDDDPLEKKAPPVDHFDRVGSSNSRCGAVSPYSPYPTLSEIAVFRFGPSPIPDCDGGTTLGGTIAPGLPEEEIAQALEQRYNYEMEFESDTNTCGPSRPITQGDPDNISLPIHSENGATTPEPTRIREVFEQIETANRQENLDCFPNDVHNEQRYDYEMEFELDTNIRPITQGEPDNISLPMYSENGGTTPEPTQIREVVDQIETTIPGENQNGFPNDVNIKEENQTVPADVIDTAKQNAFSFYNNETKDAKCFIYDKSETQDPQNVENNLCLSESTQIEDESLPIVDNDYNK